MEDRYLFKAKRLDWRKFPEKEQWIIGYYVLGFDVYEQPVHLIFEPTSMFFSHGETDGWTEIDPSTICQCTGLKDKNGKRIWENDILDGFTYPYMSDGAHNYYAEVCWCSNVPAFGIYTQKYPKSKVSGISAGMTEIMGDWNSNDWEVIGNIFDNPKLLESEG